MRIQTISENTVRLRCQRCGHEWDYKGKNRYFATCPHCRIYVSVKKSKILLIGKEAQPKQSEVSVTITSKEDAHNHG